MTFTSLVPTATAAAGSFVYRCSGTKGGIKKSIKVKIQGTECYDVSLSMELGKLVLNRRNPDLHPAKHVYIIFEVFYANFMSVSVTIGEWCCG